MQGRHRAGAAKWLDREYRRLKPVCFRHGLQACVVVAHAAFFLWLLWGPQSTHTRSLHVSDRCNLGTYHEDVQELDLKNCSFATLPASIERFKHLRKLDLAHNALHDLPWLPTSLEVVFLLGNRFGAIPESVTHLRWLRMLSLKNCQLVELDVPLPTTIQWLILTGNKLRSLPHQIGDLRGMRKLMLANNQLSGLPDSMSNLVELELLRLSNNRLKQLPEWIFTLPKLAWLAIAGNPAVLEAPARKSLVDVDFRNLQLGQPLGEGTSGVVYHASWHRQAVAVKMFKSELSSDGRIIDEIRASCAVEHPSIQHWIGFFTKPQYGGVIEFMQGWHPLGHPPSLQTITRDTYPPDATFDILFVTSVARAVASAFAHIHSIGLSHGDLYAHNILVEPHRKEAKVHDFGASFFYGLGSPHARDFQSMEVRAFGLLLDELLAHLGAISKPSRPEIQKLVNDCIGVPHDRPMFADIVTRLAGLWV